MKKAEREKLLEIRDWLFFVTKPRLGKTASEIIKTRDALSAFDRLLRVKTCRECNGYAVIQGRVLESGPCNSDWKYERVVCPSCEGYGREGKKGVSNPS